MRLWLLILSAFVMCQAISQETPMEAFRSLSKHALRVNGLSKVDPALTPWKTQFTDAQQREAFLSSVHPIDDKNSQQWATFGFACEFLDQREDAISAYLHVLALRKTHSAVRLRLYQLNTYDQNPQSPITGLGKRCCPPLTAILFPFPAAWLYQSHAPACLTHIYRLR